ncbi:xpg i-region family protein [Stylonychia lemnae]|uniref:Xpg i-region family protein n=1 Tax=Stylonychia lemnae TaxID=5949 RepID=A0A078BEZ2_STYLE|nr:xpg i-region family protein [Stylonychia lemnae]|eukprot:CDW91727.1 xpg i-region family protein [Stylonychia lemnae]
MKYAQISTRCPFYVNSNLKLNPHEPEITKNVISEKQQTCYGSSLYNIYQGGKINGALSTDGELFLSVNQAIIEAFQSRDQISENPIASGDQGLESYIVPHKVVYVAVGGQDLSYIDQFGQVYSVVSTGSDVPNSETKILQPMKINIPERAKFVSVGLWCSYAVSESNKIYHWQQGFITNDDKPTIVDGISENIQITDIKSSNFSTIFLTQHQTVFEIDHALDYQLPVKVKLIKKLTNIKSIASSFAHLLALERHDILPLAQWDSKQVEKWFNDIGLNGCCNIVKYKNIDGQQIQIADTEFLNDTLGIICQFEQSKFRYEISKIKEGKVGEHTLYGWGSNQLGQLGLLGSNYPGPQQIPLPDFQDPNDFIEKIKCGKRNSAIITNKGEVWITGNFKIEKVQRNSFLNQKEQQAQESKKLKNGAKIEDFMTQEEINESKRGKQKQKAGKIRYATEEKLEEYWEACKIESERKKKHKNHQNTHIQGLKDFREEYKKEIDKEKALKHRWLDFTHSFNMTAFGKNYQVENLSMGNRFFIAICTYRFNKTVKITNNHKDGMKFKGADKVIKRVEYLMKQNKDKKYTICYEDRFLGLIESELEKFIQKSEVPYHRIQLFKCDDEVIWDRKKKFTML